MNTSELIQVERDAQGLLVITLNRPEKRNALSLALMDALREAVDAAGREAGNRVLILRGAGRVFCAGLDLQEAAAETLQPAIERVGQLMQTLHNSPLITIAAVQGAAIAGGAGLMSACDLAVMAEDAHVGYPEVRRGIVAAVVMTFLRRQVREREARELLLLGEPIDARRAKDMGLVNRVVPAAAVMDEARRLAGLAVKGAPLAAIRTKQLLDELWPRSISEDVRLAMEHHLSANATEEAREGVSSFFERREPRWTPTRPDV